MTTDKLRSAFRRWTQSKHFCDPKPIDDIHVTVSRRCRPRFFDSAEEEVLTGVALHFERNNTPLSKHGLADLVQHYVTMLPNRKIMKDVLVNGRPSHYWVDDFVSRNGLDSDNLQVVEGARIESLSREHICEHIARVGAALKRYNIRDARYIF